MLDKSLAGPSIGIVTGDFVLTGGMDRANYALADYLARQGIPLELVAHRFARSLQNYSNLVFHSALKPLNSYFLGGRHLDRTGRQVGNRILSQGGRFIVNGANCLVGDANWVHYVHAAYQPETKSLSRRFKQMIERPMQLRAEKKALSAARVVIANSNATKSILVNGLGICDDKVKTIYYGMDGERFTRASHAERKELRSKFGWDESPRVMFVGALGDRRKGFDTLASAWLRLVQLQEWNAKLVVVGSGSEQLRWKSYFASNAVNSVEFLGFRDDVHDLLRAADCLVSPTRYEAYGLGVQEAICCGLPAFVSREAGVAERYPSSMRDLLLNDPSNVFELARKLEQWRTHAEAWSIRLRPLSESLQTRTWDMMAFEIVQNLN